MIALSVVTQDTLAQLDTSFLKNSLMFTLPNVFDVLYFICESSASRKIDLKGAIFRVVLASISIKYKCALVTCVCAKSASNASILNNSVTMFLSKINT